MTETEALEIIEAHLSENPGMLRFTNAIPNPDRDHEDQRLNSYWMTPAVVAIEEARDGRYIVTCAPYDFEGKTGCVDTCRGLPSALLARLMEPYNEERARETLAAANAEAIANGDEPAPVTADAVLATMKGL